MKNSKKNNKTSACAEDKLPPRAPTDANVVQTGSSAMIALSPDPALLLRQFNEFHDCVERNKVKSETATLNGLLLPILLHTFSDLFNGGHLAYASELLKQKEILLPKKELLNALLSNNKKVVDLFLKDIKGKKFKISLDEGVLKSLLIQLKEQGNAYVLDLLKKCIDFKIRKDDQAIDVFEKGEREKLYLDQPILDSLARMTSKLKLSSYQILPSINLMNFLHFNKSPSCSVISSDESFVACGLEDSSIILCRLQPHKNDQSSFLKGHLKSVSSVDFLPDSRWLISGSFDKTIRLWDAESRKTYVIYRGHTYHVTDVTACSTGSMFASCSYDRTVKLWSTDRAFPLRIFLGHEQSVNRVACHPNGNYLATGSSDATVRLWSIQDGKCVRLMSGHKVRVDALAFSPDGKYLASAGEDASIKVYDLTSGSLFDTLTGHTDHIYSLDFDRRTGLLASGSTGGNIFLWNLKELAANPTEQRIATFSTNSCMMYLRFGSNNVLHAVSKSL